MKRDKMPALGRLFGSDDLPLFSGTAPAVGAVPASQDRDGDRDGDRDDLPLLTDEEARAIGGDPAGDLALLRAWVARVPGLLPALGSLAASGACGLSPNVFGALVELGIFNLDGDRGASRARALLALWREGGSDGDE